MRALGFEVKKADVLKIMKDYDRESTGKISFDDFNEVSKYNTSLFVTMIYLHLLNVNTICTLSLSQSLES